MSEQNLYSRLYKQIFRIRYVEEEVSRIYPSDKIKSPIHLSIGQEFIAVGVCDVLKQEDVVFGSYRSHAMYLAKGGDLNAMIAELFGKEDGCARGKGGSMHLVDNTVGVMGASAVVASTIPQAVGYAFAITTMCSNSVVVCFFGDGATEEVVFYESLNFATLHSLPILFVCENNFYAIHSRLESRTKNENISRRISGFPIPTKRIHDGDVLQIRDVANSFIDDMRAGSMGPAFLECLGYRWKEHVGPNDDWELGYRKETEVTPWKQCDALNALSDLISSETKKNIESQVQDEVNKAFKLAEKAEFPNEYEKLVDHVYA